MAMAPALARMRGSDVQAERLVWRFAAAAAAVETVALRVVLCCAVAAFCMPACAWAQEDAPEVREALPLQIAAVAAAATTPGQSTVSMLAEWRGHGMSSDTWKVGGGQDSGTGDGYFYQNIAFKLNNVDGVSGGISYQAWLQQSGLGTAKSNGAYAGTSGEKRALEDIRIWLTGNIAKCYDVSYTCLMATGKEYHFTAAGVQTGQFQGYTGYAGFLGKTFSAKNGAWTHVGPATKAWSYLSPYDHASTRSVKVGEYDGGAVGVRKITVKLTPKSYVHRVMVRYQNADGTWGSYSQARSASYAYGAKVPSWARGQDAVYQAATLAGYTAGYADTTSYVDVHRRAYTLTFDAGDGSQCQPVERLAGALLGKLPVPTPSDEGLYFDGWRIAGEGGTLVTAGTTMGTGDCILEAVWRSKVVMPLSGLDGLIGLLLASTAFAVAGLACLARLISKPLCRCSPGSAAGRLTYNCSRFRAYEANSCASGCASRR